MKKEIWVLSKWKKIKLKDKEIHLYSWTPIFKGFIGTGGPRIEMFNDLQIFQNLCTHKLYKHFGDEKMRRLFEIVILSSMIITCRPRKNHQHSGKCFLH